MLNLRKTSGYTMTGIHMLQRHGKGYRFRCNIATLERLTSVSVKPEFFHLFGDDGEAVFNSELFESIEEGTAALIEFVEKVCGVKCRV